MVSEIRKVIPNAKLVYNNSPSFNWTLNFRQQVYDAMKAAGKDVSPTSAQLMSVEYDDTELAKWPTRRSAPSRLMQPAKPASSTT
jgi:isocitrate lyase